MGQSTGNLDMNTIYNHYLHFGVHICKSIYKKKSCVYYLQCFKTHPQVSCKTQENSLEKIQKWQLTEESKWKWSSNKRLVGALSTENKNLINIYNVFSNYISSLWQKESHLYFSQDISLFLSLYTMNLVQSFERDNFMNYTTDVENL